MDIFRNLTRLMLAAGGLVGLLAVGSVQAATSNPGAPQPTSTGTLDVSVTVGDLVWIQNLDPIALTYVAGANAVANEPFCIYSTTAAFDITISSLTSTASTTFLATGQAVPANTVNYGVNFDLDTDASDGGAVTEALTLGANPSSNTAVPPDCSVDNAAIQVTFLDVGNLAAAPADTYRDELTLLVVPN